MTKGKQIGLVKDWQQFVMTVESGYDESIYDYTNDLSTRDLIQRLLENGRLAEGARERLAEWDERFKRATVETGQPLLPARTSSWWWFRIPCRPGAELRADLESEGI